MITLFVDMMVKFDFIRRGTSWQVDVADRVWGVKTTLSIVHGTNIVDNAQSYNSLELNQTAESSNHMKLKTISNMNRNRKIFIQKSVNSKFGELYYVTGMITQHCCTLERDQQSIRTV